MTDFQVFLQVMTAVVALFGPIVVLIRLASQFGELRTTVKEQKERTEEQIDLLRNERRECQEREVRAIEQLRSQAEGLDTRLRTIERIKGET